jgi:hypothetical protein
MLLTCAPKTTSAVNAVACRVGMGSRALLAVSKAGIPIRSFTIVSLLLSAVTVCEGAAATGRFPEIAHQTFHRMCHPENGGRSWGPGREAKNRLGTERISYHAFWLWDGMRVGDGERVATSFGQLAMVYLRNGMRI